MPTIDLVDETYLRAPIDRVTAIVHDRARWARWWPDLDVSVFMDRGAEGVRWNVTGALVGSMEVWLEAYEPPLGGVLLHYFLRADPTAAGSTTTPAPLAGSAAAASSRRRALASKQIFWALKDELEAGMQR